jgi:muconolactone D-isomerase
MEFFVEFVLEIPDGVPQSEIDDRRRAESAAAAELAAQGHIVRVWTLPSGGENARIAGLYRADSDGQLDEILRALPLYDWMRITVTPLAPHPNDPAGVQ